MCVLSHGGVFMTGYISHKFQTNIISLSDNEWPYVCHNNKTFQIDYRNGSKKKMYKTQQSKK